MTLYEGIALIQEKQAVVLDIGTEYTKFGFTGEPAPRCIIRTEFWCPEEHRYKRVFDYKSEEELFDNIVHLLHLLYFRYVLVNPKERKVVVVESLLTPSSFRENLARALFVRWGVPAAVWADAPRLAALTLATPVALVVAVGAREAEVVPVIHGSPILKALQYADIGARAVHDELARLLDQDNGRNLHLSDQILEDIKVKTCFVIDRERALQWFDNPESVQPAKNVQYPLGAEGGAEVTVSGRTRELSAEVIFMRDNELASLADLVLQSILQSPIDNRRELAENILLIGGTACMPGLKARLAQELRHLITLPPYCERLGACQFKFHRTGMSPNVVPWTGGALLAAGDALSSRLLPRHVYTRDLPPPSTDTPLRPRLADWVSLVHTTR